MNAVVLWTTRYIDAAVAQLRAEGHDIRDEGIARLSPLKHKNLNCLGRYSFSASRPVDGCGPCATRTPSTSTMTTERRSEPGAVRTRSDTEDLGAGVRW